MLPNQTPWAYHNHARPLVPMSIQDYSTTFPECMQQFMPMLIIELLMMIRKKQKFDYYSNSPEQCTSLFLRSLLYQSVAQRQREEDQQEGRVCKVCQQLISQALFYALNKNQAKLREIWRLFFQFMWSPFAMFLYEITYLFGGK